MPTIQTTVLAGDDAGTAPGRTEEFALIDVVNQSIRTHRADLQRHRVHVVRHFHALPTICGQRDKVLQILSELIAASDRTIDVFSSGERKLTLRVDMRNGGARVEVEVEGIGIPRGSLLSAIGPAQVELVFGNWIRLHNVAAIAKQLGGALWAFDAEVGYRKIFCLEIPLRLNGDCHA